MTRQPIILVGGGTGGHIYPLIAIAEELVSQEIPFFFIVSKHGREREVVEQYHYPSKIIQAGKLRRYQTLSSFGLNIIDFFRNIIGFFQSVIILISTDAPVVFSKAGYVALPVVMAAHLLGRKIIIHESDMVIGLTNRMSMKWASWILTAFNPKHMTHELRPNFQQVGIPIRKKLRQAVTKTIVSKKRPMILILAGSQGSTAINAFVEENLNRLVNKADIIHAAGSIDFPHLESKSRIGYQVFEFIDQKLPEYFLQADLIIGRASATIIAEAALFAKAMYLIPLPHSAGDHQLKNAQELKNVQAIEFDEQKDLDADRFYDHVISLLSDSAKRKRMGEQLRQYFHEEQSLELIVSKLKKY